MVYNLFKKYSLNPLDTWRNSLFLYIDTIF